MEKRLIIENACLFKGFLCMHLTSHTGHRIKDKSISKNQAIIHAYGEEKGAPIFKAQFISDPHIDFMRVTLKTCHLEIH